jgi:hypothetical protein
MERALSPPPHGPDNLSSFVNKSIGEDLGYSLGDSIQNRLSNYKFGFEFNITTSLLSTLFCQIMKQVLPLLTLSRLIQVRPLVGHDEFIVVAHGENNFTLLLLLDGLESEQPIILDPNDLSVHEIRNAIERWNDLLDFLPSLGVLGARYSRFILREMFSYDAVANICRESRFKIIVQKKPLMEFQSQFPFCYSPAHGLILEGFNTANSTVGVYAENARGQIGATICFHSLGDIDTAIGEINAGKNRVIIDGNKGIIDSYDPVSDSCFVIFDDQISIKNQNLPTHLNVLRQKTPRQYEDAIFEGINSGKLQTQINGWSVDLPFVTKSNQLKVYTSAVTNPGDSGSGLITKTGQELCGFAFMRSGIEAVPQLSSWIWAESVFNFHNLKY